MRVIQGVFQGAVIPSLFALAQKWLPEHERNKLFPIIIAGAQFGLIASYPISSLMGDNFGWESIFYTFGSVGCVWFVFYAFLAYSDADEHPRISEDERAYIRAHITASKKVAGEHRRFPPLLELVTNMPFLVMMASHIGGNWGQYTLMSGTPLFLANIHHMDLATVQLLY